MCAGLAYIAITAKRSSILTVTPHKLIAAQSYKQLKSRLKPLQYNTGKFGLPSEASVLLALGLLQA